MANSRNSESPELLHDAVAACLRRHLLPDHLVVLGFSGGRDSVALLRALHRLQSACNFRLAACHINHGLSPRAGEWQLFCQRCCDELGIHLKIIPVTVPRNSSEGLEAAARKVRYAAFNGLSADWMVLAQHRGDQAETLLFNLVRGTGLAGMAGMREVRPLRPGLRLMRPLLGVPRTEIDAYLARHDLEWVDDESNRDTGFSRNFMRHEIFPLLHSRFPAAEGKLASAAGHFVEALMLLDELAVVDLRGSLASFPIPISCFANLSEPRIRNLLRFLLTRHDVQIPSEERLIEAVRQLSTAMPDRHPAIVFGDWQLCRKRGKVHLDPL